VAEFVKAMRIERDISWRGGAKGQGGFTLAEVVVSMAMAAMTVGAIISCYLMAAQRSEWTTASTAASQLAMDRLAQMRVARWDLSFENGNPPGTNDLVEGFFVDDPAPLDMPLTGTVPLMATNQVTVTRLAVDRPVLMLRVDCVWSLMSRGPFTNTVVSYRAPDQ
jgi:type II secretory pathway pseudopilin PulG